MTEFLEIITHGPGETEAVGARLAELVKPGAVLALFGDLAAGKTCLARGMAQRLAGAEIVHSPTFTLVNEYGQDKVLYHIDLYRLGSEDELLTLGYEDFIESGGVCVIEWADRAPRFLPARRLDIYLEHAGGDTRLLRFEDHGALPEGWQQALTAAVNNMERGDPS